MLPFISDGLLVLVIVSPCESSTNACICWFVVIFEIGPWMCLDIAVLLYARMSASLTKPHLAIESPAPWPDPRNGSGFICPLYVVAQPC